MLDRVHPNPIAQQRATGFAPRRVDRDDRDLQCVVLIEAEAANQLVGERALARPARPRHAKHRNLDLGGGAAELIALLALESLRSRVR
jgi:hypothetical protein